VVPTLVLILLPVYPLTALLCTIFSGVHWYTVYTFFRLLPPNGILPGAKFTLRQTLAFSCIGSVTAWCSNSGRKPNFAVWY